LCEFASHQLQMAPSLRNRKPPKHPETGSDTDAGDDALDEPNTPSAPAGATKAHSKGEGKLQKVVKRLVFGTLLLVTLCVIVASGHLATLGLVQVHAPSAPRHTRPAMHHALHRALRPKP
jgi:phosphatidate cytidylyltransferase